MLSTICFDADDTLWHNERFFRLTQQRFFELLTDHADARDLAERLLAAERRNLGHYGFGIKGFMLSMIETALDVTDDRVSADVIREILNAGREMLSHPIELLPGAEEAIAELASGHALILITKGDLLDQERKLAQSGLGDAFDGVEIVSEKTVAVYSRIFTDLGVEPGNAVMTGNSLRSDILPVLDAGGWAVHVPHEFTWEIEAAEPPDDHPRFRRIDTLKDLSPLIETLSNQT